MTSQQRELSATVWNWFARAITMRPGYEVQATLIDWGDATSLVDSVFNAVMLVTSNVMLPATRRLNVLKCAPLDALMSTNAKAFVIIQLTVRRVALKCRRQSLSVVTNNQCDVMLILQSFPVVLNARKYYNVDTGAIEHVGCHAQHIVK